MGAPSSQISSRVDSGGPLDWAAPVLHGFMTSDMHYHALSGTEGKGSMLRAPTTLLHPQKVYSQTYLDHVRATKLN